jgi:hypothetical protein
MGSKVLELLVYSLICFGIAFGIGQTKLTFGFRRWLSQGRGLRLWLLLLLECLFCCSWHLGWAAVYFRVAPYFARDLDGALRCAFFTAASSLILGKLAGALDHD